MSLELLQEIWFVLWCVIWIAFFVFDSFTIGTGMMFPFIGKDKKEHYQLQEVVGPFWNGAEVWLITAGGATFAAFPPVYAEMFSQLYVPFFLILFALIFRATGLELMYKDENKAWIGSFKWAFTVSSFLIAFVFGVFFTNLYTGVPIGASGFEGSIFSLFHLYAIIGGLLFVVIFLTAGSAWINLKAEGAVADRSFKIGKVTAPAVVALLGIYFVATGNKTSQFNNFNDNVILYAVPSLAFVTAILAMFCFFKKKMGLAFTFIASTILLFFTTGFIGMFPNMLPSSVGAEFSLTLYNSSASQLTLQIMFIVACIFVPIVLAYQLWVHFLFKDKVKKDEAKGYSG